MSDFHRRGHYRTNNNGTTFWVRDHDVLREEYTLEYRNREPFINGARVIPNYTCPECGQKVFFYQNEHGSKVFFDRLGHPWPKHGCFKGIARAPTTSANRIRQRVDRETAKADLKAALERRGQVFSELLREREERHKAAEVERTRLEDQRSVLRIRRAQLKAELPKKNRRKSKKKNKTTDIERSYQKICRKMGAIKRRLDQMAKEMLE